jgi:acetyl-CoA carboxylase biotin carboxyl carrier protein
VEPVEEIAAHITGTVWKIDVAEGDELVILESMKMEMPVECEVAGTVDAVLCAEGQAVSEGDVLLVVRTA